MKMLASVIRILVIFGICVFSSLAFSVTTPESKTKNGQQGSLNTNGAEHLVASNGKGILNSFGVRIAGTYLVRRTPEDGPSRIMNIFADGNLTSIQSTQVGGSALEGESFSNQHGTWKPAGGHEIDATVLNLSYKTLTGEFIGTAIAHYKLQFDSTLQTVMGDVKGKIFSPDVDPLNPGETKPIAEFSDSFKARRIRTGN